MNLSKLSVSIDVNLNEMKKGLAQASRALQDFGKKASDIGRTMSTRLTLPIVGFATASIIAFDKQAKAIAQVEQGIKSTGGAANRTSQQLQDMASALQQTTLFADEDILTKVTAQLLTFTNIANTEFDRTQQAALDLASRLGGDLQSASIQLGKALNDPIANLSALSRSGIQFSKDQKEVIKALTESGRLAEAQVIILDELEKQYGGSAEAAANAGMGGITQLKNSFGDLMEVIGGIVIESINPFVDKIKEIVTELQGLNREVIKVNLKYTAMVAAAGPALLVIGKLTLAFRALTIAMMANPAMAITKALLVLGAVAVGVGSYTRDMAKAQLESAKAMGVANGTAERSILLQSRLKDLAQELSVAGIDSSRAEQIRTEMHLLGEQLNLNEEMIRATKDQADETVKAINKIASIKPPSIPVTVSMDEFATLPQRAIEALQPLEDILDLDYNIPEKMFPPGSIGFLEQRIASLTEAMRHMTDPNDIASLRQAIAQLQQALALLTGETEKTSLGFTLLQQTAQTFTDSFGQGMANLIVQGGKLGDMLKNIGRLLLSSAIQKGIQLLLMGSGGGFGMAGGGMGLLGKLFGFGKVTGVGDALIQDNGNIVKFHPDDNILAMKDFGNLSNSIGSGGGGTVRVRLETTPVRVSNRDITFAFVQGQTQWER